MNFEKFAHEGNRFMKELAFYLNHPDDTDRAALLFRSVMHVLRDRISIQQSFHLLSQLPTFLSGLYVEEWQYRDKPLSIDTLEAFNRAVQEEVDKRVPGGFDWEVSPDIVAKTITFSLRKYLSNGQIDHITAELPKELKQLFWVPEESTGERAPSE